MSDYDEFADGWDALDADPVPGLGESPDIGDDEQPAGVVGPTDGGA